MSFLILYLIFGIFAAGCVLFGVGAFFDWIRFCKYGTKAWIVALVILAVCIALQVCGYPVV